MNIEFLNDLENKVSALLAVLEGVRQENVGLKKDLNDKKETVVAIEAENNGLKKELNQLKEESASQQERLQLTTEKIQGILARLEMVQQ